MYTGPVHRLELAGVAVDLEARVVQGDPDVHLTALEVTLLRVLARASGATVDRSDVVRALYGPGGDDGRGTDNVVARLRRKLPAGALSTVRGRGWRLDAAPTEPVTEEVPTAQPRRRIRLAGGSVVDLGAGTVARPGGVETLTELELKAVAWLADRAGQRVPREELLTSVWGWKAGLDTRTVERGIQRLRQKLEADPLEPAGAPHGAWRVPSRHAGRQPPGRPAPAVRASRAPDGGGPRDRVGVSPRDAHRSRRGRKDPARDAGGSG